MDVRIVAAPFDPHREAAAFMTGRSDSGALVHFVGYCRDAIAGRAVEALHLEHYPGFSEQQIARFSDVICNRFGVTDALIVHRVGMVHPGEAIVLVAIASAHRTEAFETCRLLMDYLKTDAPLWKKEITPWGAHWIEPSAVDRERRAGAERERP